jgi:hypothetical protein
VVAVVVVVGEQEGARWRERKEETDTAEERAI